MSGAPLVGPLTSRILDREDQPRQSGQHSDQLRQLVSLRHVALPVNGSCSKCKNSRPGSPSSQNIPIPEASALGATMNAIPPMADSNSPGTSAQPVLTG